MEELYNRQCMETEGKGLMMKTLKELFQLSDDATKNLKSGIIAVTITNLVTLLSVVVVVNLFTQLINPLEGKEISFSFMWIMLGVGIVLAVLLFFASKNDYRKTYVSCYTAAKDSRIKIAETVRKFPMSVFNSKSLAEITTNMMGDCASIEHTLSHIVPPLIADIISATIVCICILFFDWRMALSIFCTLPLSFLIILGSKKLQRKVSKRQLEDKLKASEKIQEYLEGIKVIKACNLGGTKSVELEKALRDLKDSSIALEMKTGVIISVAQFVLQAGTGIAVYVGTMLFTKGDIRLLPLLLSLAVVCRVYGPILSILTLLPMLEHTLISTKRIKNLLSIKVMEGDEISTDNCEIRFENVSFGYEDEKVINGMNAVIPMNKVTALVGPSGSGKSTMAKLMTRFWDVDSGKITIGGIDVSSVEPESLMSMFSIVFQDVTLFNDTVMNNIRIGNMDATDEMVMAAAKAAQCDEFINRMPDGYNTVLGENGSTLSGGERQRISIARAILKDAPIILLDEATASLDPENEIQVQEAITRMTENKTVIVIAHKLSTIEDVDNILVLNNGTVEEQGTHDELMNKNGLYAKLYNLQEDSKKWQIA